MTLHSLFKDQVVAQRINLTSSRMFDAKTALEIQEQAYIRFETIMRIRYMRYSFDAYDAWGLLYLSYLSNLALDSLSSDDPLVAIKLTAAEVVRSTAVLCINGLYCPITVRLCRYTTVL